MEYSWQILKERLVQASKLLKIRDLPFNTSKHKTESLSFKNFLAVGLLVVQKPTYPK